MGYSEDELLARPMVEFVHPDDRGKAASAIGMIAERGTATFAVRNVRKDGSDMWIEWTVTASPENNLTYAVGRDVTERREAEERYRLLAEEQAALRRVATLVARPGSPSEVFELVAKEVHRLLGADSAVLLQYEPEDTMTVVAVTGGLAGGLPLGTSVTLDGEGLNGIRSAVRAPIVVGGRRWGMVIAGWTHAERLADDIESRVGQFTELVATAIANADTYAQLTASRARVVATADETRRRIERDLHDGAQQRLVHTLVSLKLARRGMAETPERAADLVDEALEHAELANSELRDLAHGILPGALKAGGLRPAVEALVSRVRLPVSVDVTPERLPPALEATAYFIIAEALTNTVKHAEASSAQVTVVVDDGVLHLEARDDGVGGASTDDGTGLVGLRDRASALDGELAVRSAPGGGTVVTATLPIPAAAAAG
jgi:signal transduction histidine kinase